LARRPGVRRLLAWPPLRAPHYRYEVLLATTHVRTWS
jgi:hypothetical protein